MSVWFKAGYSTRRRAQHASNFIEIHVNGITLMKISRYAQQHNNNNNNNNMPPLGRGRGIIQAKRSKTESSTEREVIQEGDAAYQNKMAYLFALVIVVLL
jgi:hypothetical protein